MLKHEFVSSDNGSMRPDVGGDRNGEEGVELDVSSSDLDKLFSSKKKTSKQRNTHSDDDARSFASSSSTYGANTNARLEKR